MMTGEGKPEVVLKPPGRSSQEHCVLRSGDPLTHQNLLLRLRNPYLLQTSL